MTSSTDDYGDTPATSPDPETVAEGDTDQLQQDDTLLDRGLESVIDEGSSPHERPPNPIRLETHLDQELGESLEDKLSMEEPEVWAVDGPAPGSREADRAGRLAGDDVDLAGSPTASTMATDVGIAGGAASAEEAAVHVIEDEEGRDRL